MTWIGLTGPLACGKSTVHQLLLQFESVYVIDADAWARQALAHGSPLFEKVVEYFGDGVTTLSGDLDRKKLAHLVFVDERKKTWLEELIHPWVRERVEEEKQQAILRGYRWIFYDVPLLFEKSLESQFDLILLVACFREVQLNRAKIYRGWSEAETLDRLAHQKPLSEKLRKSDYVIWNNQEGLDVLAAQVAQFYRWLKMFY